MLNLFMFTITRIFSSFLIILLLESQTPEWNPLISQLRSTNFFLNYKEAKAALSQITWGSIFIFYYIHFRY